MPFSDVNIELLSLNDISKTPSLAAGEASRYKSYTVVGKGHRPVGPLHNYTRPRGLILKKYSDKSSDKSNAAGAVLAQGRFRLRPRINGVLVLFLHAALIVSSSVLTYVYATDY